MFFLGLILGINLLFLLLPFWKWRKFAIENTGQVRVLGRFHEKYRRTTFILDKWDRLIGSAVISIYSYGMVITKFKGINFIRKPLCLLWENLEIIQFNGRTGIFGKLKMKSGNHIMEIRGVLAGIVHELVFNHHALQSFGKEEKFSN